MSDAQSTRTSADRPPSLRSRVTNGHRIFAVGGDGRGAWTRRWRDLTDAHISDLGGPDHLSEGQMGLCRRCAALEVACEQLEAAMSEGDVSADTLDLFGRLVGHIRRIMETLGLKRQARPIAPRDKWEAHMQQFGVTFDD